MAERHEYLRAKFSRRNMIRGGAVTVGAVASGAAWPTLKVRGIAEAGEEVDHFTVARRAK
ncbi:hypothetical protein [Streptomyces sp. NPDC060027]|uniref:hypothetical protein n=1 Tax=Streptomyces sp. NPDC060027 TaxID=3347040 RepID=UPI003690EB1D